MGTVALSVLAIVVFVAVGRGWKWLWLGWILLTAFAGLWLIGFNIAPQGENQAQDIPLVSNVAQTLDEWRDLPTIGSYGKMLDASATTGREKSGRVRVLIWEGVIDLITPHTPLTYPDGRIDVFNALRPLIGYGPETMYVAYNRFYPAELATVEARNASPDRSHNETFDALVITGLLGFLAWQALYLSVVYFAFQYLGVIRSRRDTWIFIGLLVGGAAVGALGVILLSESIYLGVAVPTGVMAGIIFYLIYYALFGQPLESETDPTNRFWPFAVDRLLMTALVAAVLAHYVEIHFGIAISATRLYFFVYVALMVALARGLQDKPVAPVTAEAASVAKSQRKKKGSSASASPKLPWGTGWNQLVLVGLLLALALGIMGYSFITYNLPPDKVITGSADLSTLEIFRQSLLQNAKRDFTGSPFILAMFVLTWALGWLVALSEMAKHGELPFSFSTTSQSNQKRTVAAVVFIVMGLAAVAMRFLFPGAVDATGLLGRSLLLGWGRLASCPADCCLLNQPYAITVAGVVAGIGLAVSPALVAGVPCCGPWELRPYARC
ncbi:MAG: O-antigen ligase family protein [Chloroflexota bacterium]